MATGNTDAKQVLATYCESLLGEIRKQKQNTGDDNEKDIVLSLYEYKCQSLWEEINSCDNSALAQESNVVKYLQNIARLVLDSTYLEECTLVNEEFSTPTTWTTIKEIAGILNNVEKLAELAVPGKKPVVSLGAEIVECLRWRRGALCYMYGYTLNEAQPDRGYPDHYKQCLENGVSEILTMLSTRANPNWLRSHVAHNTESDRSQEQEVVCNDRTAARLFLEGILSDTHMLALMYCGELCYWHAQAVEKKIFPKSSSPGQSPDTSALSVSDFLARINGEVAEDSPSKCVSSSEKSGKNSESDRTESSEGKSSCESENSTGQKSDVKGQRTRQGQVYIDIGLLCLKKYVEIAQGPLSIGGWTTDQAKKILQYFSDS
ncbi:UPF0600 protein C5orf51 homolog [Aplysia californica]|uniref:UPF0600 protein C5orf51 homolog n=1 Tax=Aplysia californica TaxID=6500 RepID=A0ABM0JB40_APLCA|nr:UPF0600 protein C5orf51 homolog [Aplysia californica]